ncbi:MAG TPA: DUF2784 domain-containing protein [Cyclobacteriaceae bacterium]|nr:DUF2784 domain-containing protein [Cyclobacteriaceae bacterium]
MNTLLQFANVFFFVFHVALILFNLFGWIFKPLRRWNLVTLGLTAFSWFVLGIFYGWGYCFLTDWHWQIREKLGYANEFDSYIQFLIAALFHVSIPENVVNILTAGFFFVALIMSILFNLGIITGRKK